MVCVCIIIIPNRLVYPVETRILVVCGERTSQMLFHIPNNAGFTNETSLLTYNTLQVMPNLLKLIL